MRYSTHYLYDIKQIRQRRTLEGCFEAFKASSVQDAKSGEIKLVPGEPNYKDLGKAEKSSFK